MLSAFPVLPYGWMDTRRTKSRNSPSDGSQAKAPPDAEPSFRSENTAIIAAPSRETLTARGLQMPVDVRPR